MRICRYVHWRCWKWWDLVNRDLLTSQSLSLFCMRQRVLRRNVLALTCGCSTLFEHPTCETGVFSKIETTLLTVQDRKRYASILIWFELMFSLAVGVFCWVPVFDQHIMGPGHVHQSSSMPWLSKQLLRCSFIMLDQGTWRCLELRSGPRHHFSCIPEAWASIDRLVNVSTILQYTLYMTFCMLKLQDWKPSGQRAFEVSIHVKFMSSTWMSLASWRASFKSGHHFVRSIPGCQVNNVLRSFWWGVVISFDDKPSRFGHLQL